MACSMPANGSQLALQSLSTAPDSFPIIMDLLLQQIAPESACEPLEPGFFFDDTPEDWNRKRHKMVQGDVPNLSPNNFAPCGAIQGSSSHTFPDFVWNDFSDQLVVANLNAEFSPLNHPRGAAPNPMLLRRATPIGGLGPESALLSHFDAYENPFGVFSPNEVRRSAVPTPECASLRGRPTRPGENLSSFQCSQSAVSRDPSSALTGASDRSDGNGPKSPSVGFAAPEASWRSESLEGEDQLIDRFGSDEAMLMENKRNRRKLSNRESARRSRMKRQQLMLKLEVESAGLRIKNAALQKRVTEALKFVEVCRTENESLKATNEKLKEELRNRLGSMKRKGGHLRNAKEDEEGASLGTYSLHHTGNEIRPRTDEERASLEDLMALNVQEPLLLDPVFSQDAYTSCNALSFDALDV